MNKEIATIFVVDDDDAVTQAMSWLIESVGYSVKIFNNAQAFLDNYRNESGCLILDVRMPEVSGLELQDILLSRGINIPVIFVTAHGDVPMAVRAMKKQAVDFLTKPVNNQMLLESINRAIRIDTKNREALAKKEVYQSLEHQLTPREHEVMLLMIEGNSTKAIASQLGISPNTAELHRAKVMKKMQVKTLAELVSMAYSALQTEQDKYV